MQTYSTEDHRGQICFRLPDAIYHGLFHLRPPGRTPWDYADCRNWVVPQMFTFGLVAMTKMRIDGGVQLVDGVSLTPWGRKLADLLPLQKIGRNARPPLIPIRSLLAAVKPEIVATLAGETPLPKSGVGSFFAAVGVLADDPLGGDHFIRTSALRDALHEMKVRQDGPVLVDTFLTPEQMAFLRQAYSGVEAHLVELDGRSIKPLLHGYMGLVELNGGTYRVVETMKPFVRLAMMNCQDSMELFAALPEIDKVWIASELKADTTKAHAYLLHKMGWIYKRGRVWSISKLARDQLEGWQVRLRGAPVELLLPEDLPIPPDDFSVLETEVGVTEPDGPEVDEFDILNTSDMTPSPPAVDERHVGKHPALAAPYTPAPPPRIDNLYATTSAKEDDDFDIL